MKINLKITYFISIFSLPYTLLFALPTPLPQSNSSSVIAPGSGPHVDKNAVNKEEIPDIVLGSPDAKIILIEYSSINCAHCALFHLRDFPKIKAQFIDKGLVRYVYRHFPLDGQAVLAMGIIALAPENEWFDKISLAYEHLGEWVVTNPQKLAEVCNIKSNAVKNIRDQKKLIDLIIAKRYNAEKKYDIPFTPFFIVVRDNKEEILKGELTLRKLVEKLQ